MKGRAERKKNIVIGVFTAELSEAYQAGIWRGIRDRAIETGAGLVCFLGSRLESPSVPEKTANFVYQLADESNINGLIVITSAISTYLEYQDIKPFFETRKSLPQVSIGYRIPGISSITVDGWDAIVVLVSHLVSVHKKDKFAFIFGPEGHDEAEARKKIILDILQKNGIKINPELCVNGNFEKESGILAVNTLLEQKITFNALICINDRMALGAMEELQRKGYRIPEEIIVTGFDNIEESKYCTPPLSTVNQPLYQVGQKAVDEVLDLISGGEIRDSVLACRTEIRESCGCNEKIFSDKWNYPDYVRVLGIRDKKTLESLSLLLEKGDFDGFLDLFKSILAEDNLNNVNPQRWYEPLNYLLNNTEAGHRFAELTAVINKAFVLTGKTSGRFEGSRWLDYSQHQDKARLVGISLAEAFEVPVMMKRLKTGLLQLGFEQVLLAVFGVESGGKENMRILLSPDNMDFQPDEQYFSPYRELVPASVNPVWKKKCWVLQPLVFQDEALGYIMLPADRADHSVYDTLSKQLATTLKGALLLEQVRNHEKSLEKIVSERTNELIKTNKLLTEEIDTRIRLEQEVIDISNETMNRIGQDLHDDLCQHLAGVSMLTTAMKNSVSEGSRIDIPEIDRINNLLVDAIDRAKRIARGMISTEVREQGLRVSLDALVEAARKSYGVDIAFRYDIENSFLADEQAVQVYRIIQEALMNSIKHSGCSSIRIHLYHDDNHRSKKEMKNGMHFIAAEISDDGSGIPDHLSAQKGMGLKIMKYRAEKANADLQIEALNPGTSVICRIRQDWERICPKK
ncbi:MAG: substrate-binding domain-containing protein [Spirochaetales bacterium]|nr:substrate-binding domain-containing protein [Spirochaetales bacterium]